MKTNLVWTGLLMIIFLSGCVASKGAAMEEKAAKEAALREAIDNRTFIVSVNKALPMGGSSRNLTSPYTLEINGEKVKSHLPYFGRAYTVPYGGGDGLIFDSDITDYQMSFDRRGKALIEFKTKSKEDQFVYRIHIFPNGTASIDVNSVNRQPISFSGTASPRIAKPES
ncbi:MAG: DUF4251 domain-containing protein [Tannerella sp.]|nr:DUF4251 domain-containing protein [Tannerella sp.]